MSPAPLLFFCLLLLPQLGTSDHFTYDTIGPPQFYSTRSSYQSQATSTASATCSSTSSAMSSDRLQVVHRLSPCSPLNGACKIYNPSPRDVYRRDVRRIRSLFAGRRAGGLADVAAPAPAPAPAGVTMPTNGTRKPKVPGVQDYTVLVGYGTPAQQVPMILETSLNISVLRCKPCAAGASNCDPAFDTSRSSTFTHVPCGSPDCRSNCSAGSSVCPLDAPYLRGTVVQDVLTLTPSTGVHNFTFGCVDVDHPSFRPVAGALDLSRDSRSVASRLATPGTPAFSYCLPLSTGSQRGFLSIGTSRPEYPGGGNHIVKHAPLVHNPDYPNMYFVELVGISLGGKDIPIPPSANTANTTAIDVVAAFTILSPAVYAPLRDAFRAEMSNYPTAPAMHGLDTCYNFTGLQEVTIPLVWLNFSNGENFIVDWDQMLYYEDPSAGHFSVACFAFAGMPSDEWPYSVIGTLAQTSTEVVYDVAGSKVGFIPNSC